ncbi:MAG: L-threonylcarbamoyladenylate synthase [bacterium]|nr:L-threonylcarbamoyladenylate synthase [bacterium]
MRFYKESPQTLNKVAAFLEEGGVVICPTDTVYGFLADASNKKAVDTIFKVKKRPASKPLSLFVKDIKMAHEIAFIDAMQLEKLKSQWPGKYTFILKRKKGVNLYGVEKETVAIRIPNYKFLNNLLKKVDMPLAQTSVNISGQPVLTNINEIVTKFGITDILVVDDGNLKQSEPSKILDLTGEKVKIIR